MGRTREEASRVPTHVRLPFDDAWALLPGSQSILLERAGQREGARLGDEPFAASQAWRCLVRGKQPRIKNNSTWVWGANRYYFWPGMAAGLDQNHARRSILLSKMQTAAHQNR